MRTTILTLTAAAAIAAAPAAQAADQTSTLSAAAPSFSWVGGPGTGVALNVTVAPLANTLGCTDRVADCEDVLLKVQDAGKLTVSVDADDDTTDAIDLYLYKSNEAGEYQDGDLLNDDEDISEAAGATEASDERLVVSVAPGYYVAQVRFYDAAGDTYKGMASLSVPAAPVSAAPAPVVAPVVVAAPAQSQPAVRQRPARRKAACTKKARKIKHKGKRKKALKRCRRMR